MFAGQNRDELRRFYLESWRKHQNKELMQPLEAMVAEAIAQHPEYHAMLEQGDGALDKDFLPEDGQTNPFLHMGMHLALREQVSTKRPSGIEAVYQGLMERFGDAHQAEHQMMECLGQAMWEAQRSGTAPDESRYLECLKKL